MDGLEFDQGFFRGRRQDDPNALRSFYHVRIGNDVAIRVDDDTGADGMPPGDSPRFVAVILNGAVAGDDNLDYGR